MWVGASLFFTTNTHIKYMTLDGSVYTLASLDVPGAGMSVLCGKKLKQKKKKA